MPELEFHRLKCQTNEAMRIEAKRPQAQCFPTIFLCFTCACGCGLSANNVHYLF